MSLPILRNADARRLFLHKHALAEAPAGPARGSDLGALVARLGFVQVDSINTLARAHDLILHSRRPRYRPGGLAKHLETERGLFEHWTHDAALIPMAFYPHWRLKQRRDAERMLTRYRSWREGDFEAEFDRVLAHIEHNGPTGSGAFSGDRTRQAGGWWDWHPGKTALEYLWRKGMLEITRREGFTKLYDLSHRVIPKDIAEQKHSETDSVDWFCHAALTRLGFATSGEIADFWDVVTKEEARDWVARNDLVTLDVEGHTGEMRCLHAFPSVFEEAAAAPTPTGRMRVLSPFDPALRNRTRAEWLFGFRYRIEVFLPAAKRQYGYYVFPLMEGDRLVGRVDMKAQRDRGCLEIAALWPEAGVRWGKARQARFEAELTRLLRFAGLKEVQFVTDWLRSTGV